MKQICGILLLIGLLVPRSAGAEKKKQVEADYNVHFDWTFDNREFGAGGNGYTASMTIFGARLTPSAGLRIRQKQGLSHRIMAGVDLFKNFGQNEADYVQSEKPVQDITFWYCLDKKAGKTQITGIAGIYPRHLSQGEYSSVFYSDSVRFYDSSFEGLLVQFRRPHAYYEIGLDWDGKKMADLPSRREKFQLFTYGEGLVAGQWLCLGWTGMLRHFSISSLTNEVVDNHLLMVFARCDLSRLVPWDRLSLKAAYLQGYHNNRTADDLETPSGGEFSVDASWKGLGVQNRLYCGGSQQPFYDTQDDTGQKYGAGLYQNSPFYRMGRNPGDTKLYNRLEIFYRPHLCDFVDLNLSVVLHFEAGYQGWQQKASLVFDLDRLRHPARRSPHTQKSFKL